MSISAFTGEGLHKSGINNMSDLTQVTPGLVLGGFPTLGIPSIRGIGSQRLS